MVLWPSLCAVLVASPPSSDGVGAPSAAATVDARVSFLDGGAVREVERAGPWRGVFRDPLTSRTAPVAISRHTIVTLVAPDAQAALAAMDAYIVRELMPSLAMVLVASARADEDGLALAHRLMPLVAAGVIGEAYPDLAFAQKPSAIDLPPDDPRFAGQYYLERTNTPAAWAYATGDPETLIVIADNGCDLAHPDLVDKLDTGFDPIDDDDDPRWEPQDGASHGTACAGLAAASTDNGLDIAGACPECRLACARLLPAPGEEVFVSADVLTFQYALDVDADVVSNSWGFVEQIPVPAPLRDAIVTVQQTGRGGLGAVVAFAAGNDDHAIRSDELAAVDGVLCVGAVNNIGEPTQYTNYGPAVDVVAPTGSLTLDITGADGSDPGDIQSAFGGTSSATPIVSGIAALILSAAPDLRSDEVNEILMRTAKQSQLASPDDDGHDIHFGYGLVQADKAVEDALGIEPAEGEGEGEGDIATCNGTHANGGAPLGVAAVFACACILVRRSGRRSSSA